MKRKLGLILVFGAALPLAVASAAWACGVLATLTLDHKTAAAGDAITATGKNYGTAAGVSAVTIHLDSRTGPVLATTPALTGGRINETFALPATIKPGYHVIMATQNNANGTPKSGTPGRTTLQITGANKRHAEIAGAPWSQANPPGTTGASVQVAADSGGSGSQSLLAIMMAVALSLSMLAGGWVLLANKSRSARREPHFGV
jgi:hypothetical protein